MLRGMVVGGSIALASGCAVLEPELVLSESRVFVGEGRIAGLDSDRAGGLWVVYTVEAADYYAKDHVRLVHLDPAGTKTAEFFYDDDHSNVGGLAFSGDAVWLNYGQGFTDNLHVRKLDPVTGERLGSFATWAGFVDLDFHEDELRLAFLWNEVVAMDPATGEVTSRASVIGPDESTQRGIASLEDGRMWTSSWLTQEVFLLNHRHLPVARASLAGIASAPLSNELYLAWDGTHLIVAVDNQITWLTPEGL
ncbi:MAG: hypothetical protein M3680_29330 [Myxococcota bacterium]|nr:hypothetical protein [Myxococcota bacterium]